ncbi:MAG: bifunctional folylpolyglutamate synthase/dihydrofolate synthase [Ruminococcus sp.]|nr:bifunctional folylpolyglutamate synthase/dihydrofolate synthase [Ruminococcus sp.]
MNYTECMDFIGSYSKSGGRITDLSRARELMDSIGNPEKRLKFVHIAGTNGKGSTLEYIADALRLSGYKTGKFTSPFVLRYTDRIRIDNDEIDERSLCEIAQTVKEHVGDREYSQFEITMAIAMLWYEREKCDVVVLETGIGGLLDSTNVIPPPLLSVITSISLDHTAILGDTVEKIAAQKAGIIKSGSAVVLSEDNPDSVRKIVRDTAEKVGAEYVEKADCTPAADGGLFSPLVYKGVKYTPAMPGLHQYYNAVTALTACVYLRQKGFDISDENIGKAIETTQVKARVQYIDGKPPVIVDGGHNPAGVGMLSLMLMYLSTRRKKIYAVMGMVDSKDYVECVRTIAGNCDKLFAVDGFAPNAVKAADIAETADFLTETEYGTLTECVEKAKALALENDGIVVVCGSLYLASEYLNMI